MGVGKKGAKNDGGGCEKGRLLPQGAQRVTRSAVSVAGVAGPSAATERGGGPSLFPNSAQGERPALPGGSVSDPRDPAAGVADQSLVSNIRGSEEPQNWNLGYLSMRVVAWSM